MSGRKTRLLLWALALTLLLAIPLLVSLQVRWANQLWDAESERTRLQVAEQLDGLIDELASELMRWNLGVQQTSVGSQLQPRNPRPTWEQEGWMSGLIDSAYLRVPGDSVPQESASAVWYELPARGAAVETQVPPAAAQIEAEEEHGRAFGLLPQTLDDGRLLLSLPLAFEDLVIDAKEPPVEILHRSPALWVFLDGAAFEGWLEERARETWRGHRSHLDYSISSHSPEGKIRLFGSELPPADTEDGLGHLQATLDLRNALGESLALRAEACEGDPGCRGAEARSHDEMMPAVFVTIPGGEERWYFDVRIHDDAIDPQLRELWTRNLAIGLAALGVLGLAVALLMFLTVQSQRLARAQFDFVTGVSHELRTPLSVLRSASANLADGLVTEPPQVQRYGQVLTKEVRRLGDLVERILGFTRSAEEPDSTAQTDFEASLASVTERLKAEIADRGVSLEQQIEAGLPPIAVQTWVLESVLHNLLSNALKYGGQKIRIEATMTRVRRRLAVEVSVRDWGPGLSRAERRRAFEPFFRGRLAKEAQQPGTGLGLSWVARLAQRYGGRLIAESSLGKGSRFGVTLPAAVGEA